jgi:hypothetical protein
VADDLPQQAAAFRRSKVRVAFDWTLDLVFEKDFVQFLTVRGPSMSLRLPPAAAPEQPEEPTAEPPVLAAIR